MFGQRPTFEQGSYSRRFPNGLKAATLEGCVKEISYNVTNVNCSSPNYFSWNKVCTCGLGNIQSISIQDLTVRWKHGALLPLDKSQLKIEPLKLNSLLTEH